MNEEIFENLKKDKKIGELFSDKELKAIYDILLSESSDIKKKELLDALIKEEMHENI